MLVHSFHQLKQIENPNFNLIKTDCYVNNIDLIKSCDYITKNEIPFELEETVNLHKSYSRKLFDNHSFVSPYVDVKLFLDHVNDIIYKYANLFDLLKIKVRLELLNKNTCFLYHHDHINHRLICTYSGLGTEYLEDDNVNWANISKVYKIPEDKNKAIVKDINKIKQLNPLEVAIMKGCNGNSENGLMHKSPECDNDNRRLILIID